MGYVLYTAEKPSVAAEIAKVIGATKKCNGYFEGNGIRVTWAVGHLVGLAEPEEYGYISQKEMWDSSIPENKKRALEQLPLIPDDLKLVVLPSTKDQFNIMSGLMNDSECDYIVDCGDAGPEGHILQWFIRQKANCSKMVKRFMATSMTEEAIKDALNNLQPEEKYLPVIQGEFCKKKADWIMGMSMSRAASIIYNARVDVGRVQSPTLFFVVKRYLDVMNFVSKDYFIFQAKMKEGFNIFFKKDSQEFFPKDKKDQENRLLDKSVALHAAEEIKNTGKGIVRAFETKNKATDRPQLYDIIELERDGNRLYSYSADDVLKAAQSLYETHKITTYPRTDSRYITHDLQPLMVSSIQDISTHSKYAAACNALLKKGLNIDKKIVDDSKVTDHHAIIVTEKLKGYDLTKLSELESNILDLIITRMIVAFSPKYLYKETIINIEFPNGMVFSACGKIPMEEGWKAVEAQLVGRLEDEEKEQDEEQIFPNLAVGKEIVLDTIEVVNKKTTPPKLHTEATLLTAMQTAGTTVEGGAILKGRGIGTQSTRAAIIKQLFTKGYIVNQKKGKTNYLIPTKQGISVIKVLPVDLYSPKITADWENQIAEIVAGNLTENDFMNTFDKFIYEKLEQIRNNKVENVDFSYDKTPFAKCPWCGSDVFEGSIKDKEGKSFKNVYCGKKECKLSLRFDDLAFNMRTGGKKITNTQMKKILEKGEIEVNCVSKNKVGYKAICRLIKTEAGWARLSFELPTSSQSKTKGQKQKNIVYNII